MFYPTKEGFRKKCRQGNLVPVAAEIMADLETPVSAFLKFKDEEYAFLLESVEGESGQGRYSFLGAGPRTLFRASGQRGEFYLDGKWKGGDSSDPLSLLEEEMCRYRFVPDDRLPPFSGGAVGYLAYDGVRYFERLPETLRDDLGIPTMYFMLTDTVLAFDRQTHKITVITLAEVKGSADRAYSAAVARINTVIERLRRPVPSEGLGFLAGSAKKGFRSKVSQARYHKMVEQALEYIRAGDILQGVLSLRFEAPLYSEPFQVYRALRVLNPSPYMFYLRFGDTHIAGSSPELMVKKKGSDATVRPIAGTRPRGRDAEEDAALERELLGDEKERAEHVMLVDLGRNDLGRVCLPGTISIPEYQKIDRYSHVMHMVSTVTGKVRPEQSAFDLVRATFPAGTVSGAPKVRAMEIIEELEAQRRGVYAGMVGYFDYSGNFDSAIAIRTILAHEGRAYIQAGAGIVADSTPEREYQECRHKAQALFRAIEMAQGDDEMILLIDNYDSFTYNLYQYLLELGQEVTVYRNDALGLDAIRALQPKTIVISPGPGTPDDAGICLDVIEAFGGEIPILGVCLGMQCIAQAFGGKIVRAERLMHGKTSMIRHDGKTIFSGLDSPLEVGRYHSLIPEARTLPQCFEISATTAEGEIMALRHRDLPIEGVQFHPESILTPQGKRMLHNFLSDEDPGMRLREGLEKVINGRDLSGQEAEDLMDRIMRGEATSAQIAALLTALRIKGETVEEITGFARVMRRKVTKITAPEEMIVDTCGTGGDLSGSFNISTAAAFVAAGAGVRVAKHGNRSVSSACGSADVLEAAGVKITVSPKVVEKALREVGIAFFFAPLFHPAMKHAVGPRREMGVRTVFNILGPLSNPVGAAAQVIGVYDAELTEVMAKVLGGLGVKRAFVVHGLDGMDEITLTGKTKVTELRGGKVKTSYLSPEDLGLSLCGIEDLKGGSAGENAETMGRIFSGAAGPLRDVVLLNAAATLVAAGKARDFKGGLRQAAKAVDSGAALEKLKLLGKITRQG